MITKPKLEIGQKAFMIYYCPNCGEKIDYFRDSNSNLEAIPDFIEEDTILHCGYCVEDLPEFKAIVRIDIYNSRGDFLRTYLPQ